MQSPCEGCVVKPMCTVGCEELWKYHNSIKSKSNKHNRWARRCINCSIVISLLWGASLIFGFVEQIDGTSVYKIGSVTFSFWWHTLGYMIPSTFFFINFAIQKRCEKKLHALLYHDRLGQFITKELVREVTEEITKEKSKKGDMIP